jgi:hypothetical protein
MANSSAFESGWTLGAQLAQERRARHQALNDAEFQTRVSRYAEELQNNRARLSSIDPTQNPNEYSATVQQMQANLHALREMYHPDKNPGAIECFGHVLTDALHITNPQHRIQLVAQRRANDIAGDEREAQELAAATPATPNEVAEYRRKFIEGGFSPEDAEKAVRVHFGVEPKETPEKYFSQLSTTTDAQGKQHYWRVPMSPGDKPEEVDFNGQTVAPKNAAPIKGTLVRSPQSPTGFAQTWVDRTNPSRVVAWQPVTPSRYYAGSTSNEKSTDAFGITTSSTRTTQPTDQTYVDLSTSMQLPASPEGPERGTPDASSSNPPVQIRDGKKKPTLKELRNQAAFRAPKNEALDAAGHIPAGAGNPHVVEAANQLLDGMDLKELRIPQRDIDAASALARQYGWAGQGTFTPQQKVLINEAGAKLQQLLDSTSLSVLDNAWSRAKITAVLHASSGKSGIFGEEIGTQASRHLTPQEQEFVRVYNAAVGVIAGLGPITRGNKATEAAVGRLMQELPSILQSANSQDAKARVRQLIQEITVAEQTTGRTPLGATTAPPSPQGAGGSGSSAREFLRNFRAGGSSE